jgi:predicted N-acetyltransferase YhbS
VGHVNIREMRDDDVGAVLEVLKRALGETPILRRTEALWHWKHRQNPFGQSLVLVAESEGQIAGVRAMMRWDLLTPSGEMIRCLRPVDTATDPSFARMGIFKDLTMTAIEEARERGIDLIFNTPNQASGPGYKKMGWSQISPIGVMIRPLFRLGSAASEDVAPDPAVFFTEELGDAAEPINDRPATGLRTPRSDEYMKWRFSGHPTVRYGAITNGEQRAIVRPNVRSGRKEVVISELFGNNPSRAVRHVARVSRSRYLAGWFSPASPERKSARAGGLIPVPRVQALTLMALPLGPLPIDIGSINQWDFSLGDLELL